MHSFKKDEKASIPQPRETKMYEEVEYAAKVARMVRDEQAHVDPSENSFQRVNSLCPICQVGTREP